MIFAIWYGYLHISSIYIYTQYVYHATVLDRLNSVRLSNASSRFVIIEQRRVSWKMATTTTTTTATTTATTTTTRRTRTRTRTRRITERTIEITARRAKPSRWWKSRQGQRLNKQFNYEQDRSTRHAGRPADSHQMEEKTPNLRSVAPLAKKAAV